MTILTRAATIAALLLSLGGMLGASAPGSAKGLDRAWFDALAVNNPATIVSVPAAQNNSEASDQQSGANFDSLAEAVAAQSSESADEKLHCLAGAIYFESKGEPLAGQLAVANVVINRMRSGRFPDDVCSVIKQPGQFGFVRNGRIPSIDTGRTAYRTAIAVAKVALAAVWDSPARKALYFNTPDRMPGTNLTRIASIGNHVFYR